MHIKELKTWLQLRKLVRSTNLLSTTKLTKDEMLQAQDQSSNEVTQSALAMLTSDVYVVNRAHEQKSINIINLINN